MLVKYLHSVSQLSFMTWKVFEGKNSLRNCIFPDETFFQAFISKWITIFHSNLIFENGSGRKCQLGPDLWFGKYIEGSTAKFLTMTFFAVLLVELVAIFFGQLVCVKCSPLQCSFISNQGCKISSPCPFKLKLFFNQLVCVKCGPLQYSPPFTF